jgi:hypothetical protein
MEIKYQLFEDDKLFVQKYSGLFSVRDYMAYTSFMTGYVRSKSITKVLLDFRDLDFSELTDTIPDDYVEVIDRIIEMRKGINQNELKNRDVSLVILVDRPLPTAVAHLFIKNFLNYSYCSTITNVRKILKLAEHHTNLGSALNKLENTFEYRPLE